MNLYFTLASYAVAAASGFAVAWQLQAGTISDIHLEAAHEFFQIQIHVQKILSQSPDLWQYKLYKVSIPHYEIVDMVL